MWQIKFRNIFQKCSKTPRDIQLFYTKKSASTKKTSDVVRDKEESCPVTMTTLYHVCHHVTSRVMVTIQAIAFPNMGVLKAAKYETFKTSCKTNTFSH